MKALQAFALVVMFSLLFGCLPAARAEKEPEPDELKNAVYSDTASGPDGSRVSVRVLWDDMPERRGQPTHNADRTFYPGDAFRARVTGSRTDWYEDRMIYFGVVKTGELGAGRNFDQKADLQITTDAKPGLREINFTLFPKKGSVNILVMDENGNFGMRKIYIDNRLTGTGRVTEDLEQGTYTISFESPPENVRAPPATTIIITPARKFRILAYYEYENAKNNARTVVHVVEEGAPSSLPQITATLKVCVVPYNPRFVVFPYLWLNWRQTGEVPRILYDLPFAVLVRYDGNRFDPENEDRLSLNQRAPADGISMQGAVSWPLRARGRQQRHHDNGDPAYHENGDPVMYEDREIIRDDNGLPKSETAEVSAVRADPILLGSFFLTPRYEKLENVWEEVYSHEDAFGHGPFGWLHFHDVRTTGTLEGLAGEKVYEFLTTGGNPIVFDRDYRYHKFVFDLRSQAKDWVAVGGGTLALDISLWSVAAGPGRSIRTGIEWAPLGLHQPVAVRAWRLAPWARDAADENAQVLYLDNAWMIDSRVSFEMSFIPVFDVENFLRIARLAENLAPFLGDFFGDTGDLESVLQSVFEKMGIELPDLREVVPAVHGVLYSLANLDDNMMDTIIEDIGTGDASPQRVSGRGEARATVERRGLSIFALEERAWFAGENARVRSGTIELPFDSEEEFAFDINLSGEGMAVEVVSDTFARLELRIHAPPRSGGLQRVRIFDNQGRLLLQRDFLPFAQLPFFGMFGTGLFPDAEVPQTLALQKSPGSPAEIRVELTNHWGASTVKELTVLPWIPFEHDAEMNTWGWLIAAGVFIAAWVAFVNWLREKKTRAARSSV